VRLPKNLVCSFQSNKPVAIGALKVTAFAKQHDAVDPYSFIVEGNGVKIGVITDIGIACDQVIHYFKQCHAAFLESNYDEHMLEHGGYPIHLKRRIRGGKGHLSNVQALQLFINHRPAFMSHLLLAHLSKNNNHPELVHDLFIKHANKTNIVVASRYGETPVYHIVDAAHRKDVVPFKPLQLSLFE
jgi:phosphoribosyl 1,2-cyclic phosphodiesterase